MICATLIAKTPSILIDALEGVKDKASLAEARIDYFEDLDSVDFKRLIKDSPLPLIFTNRHPDEGGNSCEGEEKRVNFLIKAIEAGAAYIDVEFRTEPLLKKKVLEAAKHTSCKVIVSWHDFKKTPDQEELLKILNQIKQDKPDIAKLVTTAHSKKDIQTVMGLYNQVDKPLDMVAFCMGNLGKISRVACLAMGSPFTFAACSQKEATAPGQLTVDKLFEILKELGQIQA